jgi:plastocyanin domain-containing protein
MQLYALSTASPVRGGISMFLFSAGTVPLMFALGALSSVLSGASFGRAFTARVMQVGAILVTVLGLTMFSNGFSLSGFSFSFLDTVAAKINPSATTADAGNAAFVPAVSDGVQVVNSTLSSGRYPAITVQQGIPVRWVIDAPQGSVNGCNNRMIIREYGIEYRFKTGENVIEFTPSRTGKFPYSCWMGMIRSSITVVAEGESVEAATGGGDMTPVPAGVTIPADEFAVAQMQEGGRYQSVTINLRDEGLEPAVLVVERAVPVLWTINNDSLDPGNGSLIFPAYYAQLEMRQGDNAIQLMPEGDFDFSTADNVFYGYVKVVDDITNIDAAAIKAEIADYETLIYPAAWFEGGE